MKCRAKCQVFYSETLAKRFSSLIRRSDEKQPFVVTLVSVDLCGSQRSHDRMKASYNTNAHIYTTQQKHNEHTTFSHMYSLTFIFYFCKGIKWNGILVVQRCLDTQAHMFLRKHTYNVQYSMQSFFLSFAAGHIFVSLREGAD